MLYGKTIEKYNNITYIQYLSHSRILKSVKNYASRNDTDGIMSIVFTLPLYNIKSIAIKG